MIRYAFFAEFFGQFEEKRPLVRFCCDWDDNIKTSVKEIRKEGVDGMTCIRTETSGRFF
jgi:hypothetical protein